MVAVLTGRHGYRACRRRACPRVRGYRRGAVDYILRAILTNWAAVALGRAVMVAFVLETGNGFTHANRG